MHRAQVLATERIRAISYLQLDSHHCQMYHNPYYTNIVRYLFIINYECVCMSVNLSVFHCKTEQRIDVVFEEKLVKEIESDITYILALFQHHTFLK